MDESRNLLPQVTMGRAWEYQVNPTHGGPNGGDTIGRRATFVTIATADRAAQSRIFARSARECHPNARLVVLTPDAAASPQCLADLFDHVIPVEQLSLPGLADMRFRYSLAELCFVLKPWVIQHLFDRFSDDPIYYFDSDIELFTPLAEVEAAIAHGANLVLTPHILRPGPTQDRERAVLLAGTFNGGFLAVAPTAPARAFVAWWCERLRTGGTHNLLEGTHGDQKWLELAPSICDDVALLRHPGYNFAYWNAHERPLSCVGGVWCTAGSPLRFVHYSQWNLQEQDSDQYLAKYFTTEYETFAGLFGEYQKKVQDEGRFCAVQPHGDADDRRTPSGEGVPQVVRNAFARHVPAVDGDFSGVFARAVAILNAPSGARRELPSLPISVLCDEIWQRYGDLRYRFDVDQESGRLAYLRWLVEDGAAELAIPAVFLKHVRSAVDRERIRELEAVDEAAVPELRAIVGPGVLQLPDHVAGLIAARDVERDLIRQQADIRLLAASNRGLRREVLSLRVRGWRDEEAIEGLKKELNQARGARDAATQRSRELAVEIATLRSWFRLPFAGRLRRKHQSISAEAIREPVLTDDGPFFEQGFVVGGTAAIAGATVRRIKSAPSGTMVFGPYVNLPAGRYAVTVDARLYQHLPVSAAFKLDVVCDSAQRVVEWRRFRLHSLARWRRCEMMFSVWDGEDYPDFEVRIWARQRTPLEIGRIVIDRLTDKAGTSLAV